MSSQMFLDHRRARYGRRTRATEIVARHRAARALQIESPGSGGRRSPSDEELIDVYLWLRSQWHGSPRMRFLIAEAAYLLTDRTPTGAHVVVVDQVVFLAGETEILEILAEGFVVSVIKPPPLSLFERSEFVERTGS